MLLITPLFNLGVDFKVLVSNIMKLSMPWLQNGVPLTNKKISLLVAPLLEIGVEIVTKCNL
jgi:hypothetical protein